MGDNRRLVAGGQCIRSCPSHGDGPAFFGRHRYGSGDPVGPLDPPTGVEHPLERAVVSPTIYGWNPLLQPGTAALASLAAAAVLAAAASHSGPGSGACFF